MAQNEKAVVSDKSVPEQQDTLKYGIFLLEKKLRNLEKKKGKVEKYMKDRTLGRELNEDQCQAVNRFDEINHNITLIRDLKKQFEEVLADVVKQQKKQARNNMLLELEQQKMKIKDVIRYKTVLDAIHDSPNLRAKLTETISKEMADALYQISKLVQVHFQPDIDELALDASKTVFQIVEGKNKPAINDITYADMRTSLQAILDADLWTDASPSTSFEPVDSITIESHKNLVVTDDKPTTVVNDILYDKVQGLSLSSTRNMDPEENESDMIFTTMNAKHVDINDFMNGPVQFMSSTETSAKYFNMDQNSSPRNSISEDPGETIMAGMTYTNRNFPGTYNETDFSSFSTTFVPNQVDSNQNLGKHNVWSNNNSLPLRRQPPTSDIYGGREQNYRPQYSRSQNAEQDVRKGHQRPGYNN